MSLSEKQSCFRVWSKDMNGVIPLSDHLPFPTHTSVGYKPGWQVKTEVSCVKVANSLGTCHHACHHRLYYTVTHQVIVASPWGMHSLGEESYFKSKEIKASRGRAVPRDSVLTKDQTSSRRSWALLIPTGHGCLFFCHWIVTYDGRGGQWNMRGGSVLRRYNVYEILKRVPPPLTKVLRGHRAL